MDKTNTGNLPQLTVTDTPSIGSPAVASPLIPRTPDHILIPHIHSLTRELQQAIKDLQKYSEITRAEIRAESYRTFLESKAANERVETKLLDELARSTNTHVEILIRLEAGLVNLAIEQQAFEASALRIYKSLSDQIGSTEVRLTSHLMLLPSEIASTYWYNRLIHWARTRMKNLWR